MTPLSMPLCVHPSTHPGKSLGDEWQRIGVGNQVCLFRGAAQKAPRICTIPDSMASSSPKPGPQHLAMTHSSAAHRGPALVGVGAWAQRLLSKLVSGTSRSHVVRRQRRMFEDGFMMENVSVAQSL